MSSIAGRMLHMHDSHTSVVMLEQKALPAVSTACSLRMLKVANASLRSAKNGQRTKHSLSPTHQRMTHRAGEASPSMISASSVRIEA
jgi:hypothetical protein